MEEPNLYNKIYRLFTRSNCVSCENKNIVFRTRDKNSAISIMKLTECWIKELCDAIEEIKTTNEITNIYLSKNDEYDNF